MNFCNSQSTSIERRPRHIYFCLFLHITHTCYVCFVFIWRMGQLGPACRFLYTNCACLGCASRPFIPVGAGRQRLPEAVPTLGLSVRAGLCDTVYLDQGHLERRPCISMVSWVRLNVWQDSELRDAKEQHAWQ